VDAPPAALLELFLDARLQEETAKEFDVAVV